MMKKMLLTIGTLLALSLFCLIGCESTPPTIIDAADHNATAIMQVEGSYVEI